MRPTRAMMRDNRSAYFVSTQTEGPKPFFRHERWARLLLSTLNHYFVHLEFMGLPNIEFPRGLRPDDIGNPDVRAKASTLQTDARTLHPLTNFETKDKTEQEYATQK